MTARIKVCLSLCAIVLPLQAQAPGAEIFEAKIRPVLAAKCFACHSSKLKSPMCALTLDTKAGSPKGGAAGPIMVPGKPAFAIPPNGTFGKSGRNILSGSWQANADVSLFKIVRFGEDLRLQIRPEFFNALNRVNFGLPGSTVASPTYGVITSASDARVIQLALRLAF